MTEKPWFKMYRIDWLGDPKLRSCSMAARGLWMDLICVMDESGKRGLLLINGAEATVADIASIAGSSIEETESALGELERKGVFSRNRKGVIFSRRMTRETKNKVQGKKNAQNAPQVNARKQRENPNRVTQSKTPRDQRPETRKEKTSKEVPKESAPDLNLVVEKAQPIDEDFASFWKQYPIKAKKPFAKKAYIAARQKTTKENILDGLERYKRTKPPDQRWAHASSWLNAERWDDGDSTGEPSDGDRPGASEFLLGLADAGEPEGWPH